MIRRPQARVLTLRGARLWKGGALEPCSLHVAERRGRGRQRRRRAEGSRPRRARDPARDGERARSPRLLDLPGPGPSAVSERVRLDRRRGVRAHRSRDGGRVGRPAPGPAVPRGVCATCWPGSPPSPTTIPTIARSRAPTFRCASSRATTSRTRPASRPPCGGRIARPTAGSPGWSMPRKERTSGAAPSWTCSSRPTCSGRTRSWSTASRSGRATRDGWPRPAPAWCGVPKPTAGSTGPPRLSPSSVPPGCASGSAATARPPVSAIRSRTWPRRARRECSRTPSSSISPLAAARKSPGFRWGRRKPARPPISWPSTRWRPGSAGDRRAVALVLVRGRPVYGDPALLDALGVDWTAGHRRRRGARPGRAACAPGRGPGAAASDVVRGVVARGCGLLGMCSIQRGQIPSASRRRGPPPPSAAARSWPCRR